jgi:hypothetical protein
MARPKLLVKRKAYVRKAYPRRAFTVLRRGKTIRIPATTVKRARVPPTRFLITDVGALGRGKKIITVKKGLLSKYGYSTKHPVTVRREALRRADRAYGTPSLFRKLQAQVVLRKRTQPEARRIFEEDLDWVRENLLSRTERLAMTKPARERWMAMSPALRARLMPERGSSRRRLEEIA